MGASAGMTDDLIQIMMAVSQNEGNFDALNTYDGFSIDRRIDSVHV